MLYIFVRIQKSREVFAHIYCHICTFTPCTYPVRICVYVRIVSIGSYLYVYKCMSTGNTYIYIDIRTIRTYTDIHAYRYIYVRTYSDIYIQYEHICTYTQIHTIHTYTYNTYRYDHILEKQVPHVLDTYIYEYIHTYMYKY